MNKEEILNEIEKCNQMLFMYDMKEHWSEKDKENINKYETKRSILEKMLGEKP